MTPIYGSRVPRFKVLVALYGKARGWTCEECPFCGTKGFTSCKSWIAHLGASHNDEHLLCVADEIWSEVMSHKFESQEEMDEFVREAGRARGVID